MDVSIIIVNYNTSKLLYDCISSVKEKTKDLNYEIIIIDNGSSDDSIYITRSFFPEVQLIENKENNGFGRANNQGAAIATGKYLFLLNTDTLLINNAIKILFDFMETESSQNVGACGANLFKFDYSPNVSYSLYFPSLFNIFCYRAHLSFLLNNDHFNRSEKIKDVAIIFGADLFIRTKLFNDLKGFDPSFFMYVEDGDLAFRIKQQNYRVISNPEAKIIHLQGTSSTTIFKYKMEIASYVIYFRKHLNSGALKGYIFIELFVAILKLIVSLITFRKSKSSNYYSLIKYIISTGLFRYKSKLRIEN